MSMFDSMFESEEFKEKFNEMLDTHAGNVLNQLYKRCRVLSVEIDGTKYINLRTLYYAILANNEYSKIDEEFDVNGNKLTE